jgi:serine/threonine protein kinase
MNLEDARGLVVEGQLLSSARFDEYQQGWLDANRPAEDGEGFVLWLVDEGELTEFQGVAVLAGLSGPYQLGPYRVHSRIKAGRLGNIYQAEQVEFQQPVSLKVFPTTIAIDAEQSARLGREARVSLQLDSPYIVKTHQIGRVGPIRFLTLESLSGETLEQKLNRDGRLPYLDACQWIQQAAIGLAAVHAQEIIHRDICPGNLWITDQGTVKIMEFGSALDAMSYVDTVNEESPAELDPSDDVIVGNYSYMSAEQAKDPQSAGVASDLYSLGCTFYHCLTGQPPFTDGNPVRLMLRHALDTPLPLAEFDPEIPSIVQDVVSYLLAKRPEDRYGSADEVAAALAAIIPVAALPAAAPVAVGFLDWVQSVDDDLYGVVAEEPQEPELQKFVAWLSENVTDEEK